MGEWEDMGKVIVKIKRVKPPFDQNEYNRRYYRENKEKLKEKRKAQRSTPEGKAKNAEAQRRFRARKKKEKEAVKDV